MTRSDPQLEQWLAFLEDRPAGADFAPEWQLWTRLEAARAAELGPLPAWVPDRERLTSSNLAEVLRDLELEGYAELHHWSVSDRPGFWDLVINRLGIHFDRRPERVLADDGTPADPTWLPGARFNIVDSCWQGDPDRVAIVAGAEGRTGLRTTSLAELQRTVRRVAAGLTDRGLAPDRAIALYMPMTAECVAAYLGIVMAGSRVVSIADSFSAEEVARRLRIADARAVVTVDRFERGGKAIELYPTVVEAGAESAVVVAADPTRPPRLRPDDTLWSELVAADPDFDAVPSEPDAVTNVLFSSGTTGDPKAIPWTQLTPVKAAMDGHFHHDIRPGDVLAWPTNVGWMMGPWLIYAALVNGAAIALHEGAPTGGDFCRFVGEAGVTMLGVVPSLVRAWRDRDATAGSDWSAVRVFSSTGEPSNRHDYLWLMSRADYRAPVIEYCGGTEVGGGHLTGAVLQPQSPAAFSTPALGLDLVILDDEARPVAPGQDGELFLVPPSVGLSQRLLNRDHHEVYYAGCPSGPDGEVLRRHGDQVARLPGGYFRAHGRADDTMNLGGIKVSSRELEVVADGHPAVYEAAAVAVQPEGEGADALVVFVVPAGPVPDPDQLRSELQREIAARLNPLFRIHALEVVDSLPRTASNKLMRRSLRARWQAGDRG